VPPGQNYDIGAQLFPLLVQAQLPFFVQSRPFHWIDIGRVSDYWTVLQRALSGEVAHIPMPGREIRPGVFVGLNTQVDLSRVDIRGPVYLGSSVKIEAGCRIQGPAWIGHGSHLRSGAQLDRCVLMEYTRIGAGVHMAEMVVSPRYCVDRLGHTTYRGDDTTTLRWSDARA
jgi:mannose-1-phosphate guanylyltransferase